MGPFPSRPLRAPAFAGALALLCSACASDGPPPLGQPPDAPPELVAETERLFDEALEHWIERIARVQRVSQQLRVAGGPLCGEHVGPVLGISMVDPSNMAPWLAWASHDRYGGGEGVVVVRVFPDMAGERAGLAFGDRILSIDGEPADFARSRVPRTPPGRPVELEVEREGERRTVLVPREEGCAYPVEISLAEARNSWADGSSVTITAPLLRRIRDDAQLAYLLGHELAHNIEFAAGASRSARNPEEEARADYVGIYLAARAGYAVSDGPELWTAILTDLNNLAVRSETHPMTHARRQALRSTLAEIAAKRERGEPLVPSER